VKKKIVIVDDFEESCQLMVEILSAEYECHYICQSEKALELIHSIKPSLILMDYKMPYVTGVELCKIIKEVPSLKQIPIIFISGAVTSDERIETLESGGDDFLSKPFHPKELMLRVQKRLRGYAVEEDISFLNVPIFA
jgi:two-component system, OmpR family, alkaline phosphatase synthesis response regulator PhoP